jgi:hypothetical protein
LFFYFFEKLVGDSVLSDLNGWVLFSQCAFDLTFFARCDRVHR